MPRNCPPLTPPQPQPKEIRTGRSTEKAQPLATPSTPGQKWHPVLTPCFLGGSPNPPFSTETMPAEELLLCLSSSGGVACSYYSDRFVRASSAMARGPTLRPCPGFNALPLRS